jgi:HEAT repeat protein
MPDQRKGISLETTDPVEQRLWNQLEAIPQRQPGEELRRQFYRQLGNTGQRRWWRLTIDLFKHPLVPAFASLLVGLVLGMQLRGSDSEPNGQLAALQAQVSALNATVAVTLMQNGSTGERLQGVHVASQLGLADPRLPGSLLKIAVEDSSNAVRSAAISALGPHLQNPEVSADVALLLTTSESPLVQLALAELVMRWGGSSLVDQLVVAAESRQLAPVVNEYVIKHIERNQT